MTDTDAVLGDLNELLSTLLEMTAGEVAMHRAGLDAMLETRGSSQVPSALHRHMRAYLRLVDHRWDQLAAVALFGAEDRDVHLIDPDGSL